MSIAGRWISGGLPCRLQRIFTSSTGVDRRCP
jgi:hypothetical protein